MTFMRKLMMIVENGIAEGANDSFAARVHRDYLHRTPPTDYWLHGRSGNATLDTGFIILATKNWDVAEFYGRNGSLWALRPTQAATILDFRDETVAAGIVRDLAADIDDGKAPGGLDYLPGLGDDWMQGVARELDPPSIVDSAGFLDLPDFVTWLWDRYQVDVVLTTDGAGFLNVTDPSTTETVRINPDSQ